MPLQAMDAEAQKQGADAVAELADARALLPVSPTITLGPSSCPSFSVPKLQHLVGTTVKMPFAVDVLATGDVPPYHLLDLRNGTTGYYSTPEMMARSTQPALLNDALKAGAVFELWWFGTVTQVTDTAPTTQFRIQFEHGRVGELVISSGQEGLLDKYRVHSKFSSPFAAAEPHMHRLLTDSPTQPIPNC